MPSTSTDPCLAYDHRRNREIRATLTGSYYGTGHLFSLWRDIQLARKAELRAMSRCSYVIRGDRRLGDLPEPRRSAWRAWTMARVARPLEEDLRTAKLAWVSALTCLIRWMNDVGPPPAF